MKTFRTNKSNRRWKQSSNEKDKFNLVKKDLVSDINRRREKEEYAKQCMQWTGNTIIPHKYEFTFVACGHNVKKQKNWNYNKTAFLFFLRFLTKQQPSINFFNRLKCAEKKTLCICVEIYKICEGEVLNEKSENLSKFKFEKWNLKNIIIEKFKKTEPFSEQEFFLRTAKGVYRSGHDSIRLNKWTARLDI